MAWEEFSHSLDPKRTPPLCKHNAVAQFESSPKCDQTKRTGAADLCQKIPDEPAIGKNSFKHRDLAPAGSLARRAALRTALQARPFPRTGASLLTGLRPHSLRPDPPP